MNSLSEPVIGATVDLQYLQALRFLSPNFLSIIKKSSALSGGEYRSTQHNRGMEFEEVRLYQAGDDVRTIDWRVTARTQKPHTKCFQEEKEKPVITLVDQRSPMFFGSRYCFKSVYACTLSALINWSCLHRGDRSGGMLIGNAAVEYHRPSRTRASLNRWLQSLSTYNHHLQKLTENKIENDNESIRFSDALKQLKQTIPRGAELILISDGYDIDKACQGLLFDLAKHHQLTWFWCYDPIEAAPPLTNQTTFSNGVDQLSVSINPNLQKAITVSFQQRQSTIEALCRQYKIRLLPVNIHLPIAELALAPTLM